MILDVQRVVADEIRRTVERQYGVSDVPAFTVEVPPSRALGDLAVTVAFQLARTLRKAPRAIATEMAGALGSLPGVARVAPAPNGYLNVYLDRPAFLRSRLRGEIVADAAPAEKTIVEHTAINPNKAAHIGHLRNAALGDTLARVLRSRGAPVEVQNYIDDLGVQVADIVVPRDGRGYHPLCAAYTRACLAPAAAHLANGRLKMTDLFEELRVRVVTPEEIDVFGNPDRLLANVNTPAEYGGLEPSQGYQL